MTFADCCNNLKSESIPSLETINDEGTAALVSVGITSATLLIRNNNRRLIRFVISAIDTEFTQLHWKLGANVSLNDPFIIENKLIIISGELAKNPLTVRCGAGTCSILINSANVQTS